MNDLQDSTRREDTLDPVFVHARREALIILGVWAVCLVWTVMSSYFTGYDAGDDDRAVMRTVFGMPSWVFWSVFVPWIAAGIASIGLALRVIREDDLGEARERKEPPEGVSEPGAEASNE